MCSPFDVFGSKRAPFCDYDEIEPGLYLGNWEAATSEQIRRDLKITHILTAYYFPVSAPDTIKTHFINVDDCPDADLLTHFQSTNAFIKEGQQNGACLVHCMAGISRSSTLVIAYLMDKYGIGFAEARKKVALRRHTIRPNCGFVDQLQLYESMGIKLDPSNLRYRIYQLQEMAKRIIKDHDFTMIKPYLLVAKSHVSGDAFKCRQCRQYLFSETNLLPHVSEQAFSWRYDQTGVQSQCHKSAFIVEILPWIEEAKTNAHGKIYCPKCQAKLGSFIWSGQSCTCGVAIEPCFKIVASNVDRCKDLDPPQ